MQTLAELKWGRSMPCAAKGGPTCFCHKAWVYCIHNAHTDHLVSIKKLQWGCESWNKNAQKPITTPNSLLFKYFSIKIILFYLQTFFWSPLRIGKFSKHQSWICYSRQKLNRLFNSQTQHRQPFPGGQCKTWNQHQPFPFFCTSDK